jgi:hypothetical protein
MRQALEKVAAEELQNICTEVELKSQWFQSKLSRQALPNLSSAEYYSMLRRIFSARRKTEAIMKRFHPDDLRMWTWELLYGSGSTKARFQAFVDKLDSLDETIRRDIASEILHFTDPERYWLWTRWMWDPKTRTGALPLVTMASCDLSGESAGEIYMRVGEAVAFVHQVGEAAGFQTISKNMFGTDVFLSCVYVVYVYTVLRMRMTQEFNKVMPGLPEFSRRLLGVYRIENGIITELP